MTAHFLAPGQRKAHYGISYASRITDVFQEWPEAAIHEMLRGFAAWSVKHKQPILALYTMCCAQDPADNPEAKKLPYLLYASTVPFNHECRDAHCVVLANFANVMDFAAQKTKPQPKPPTGPQK